MYGWWRSMSAALAPEMLPRHYGHDNTKSRVSEFADVRLSKEDEWG